MARSLSKLKEQIARLQKQADSIQNSVIARIKKEIAQHGLTAEQLFGSANGIGAEMVTQPVAAPAKAQVAKKTAAKPAKYADDQGNSWGGMGKRPQWVHDALAAGRSLEEFLVNAAKPTAGQAKSKDKATRPKKATAPARKKVTTARKPAKAAVVAASKPKAPAKKARKAAPPAKKSPAKNVTAKKARAAKAPTGAPEAGDQAAG